MAIGMLAFPSVDSVTVGSAEDIVEFVTTGSVEGDIEFGVGVTSGFVMTATGVSVGVEAGSGPSA